MPDIWVSDTGRCGGENCEINQLGGFDFEVAFTEEDQRGYSVRAGLQVPGTHNVMNAAAVLTACRWLGISLDQAAMALAEFSGTGRRFDVLGEANGVIVVDDYAHHPTEVNATLSAARARYPQRRIWAVWQPHTYSRTLALMDGFTRAFQMADEVVVTEIYAAREKNEGFSAAQVVSKMSHPSVRFIPTIGEATQYLLQNLQRGDVLLVLSAGDADQISAQVFSALKERSWQMSESRKRTYSSTVSVVPPLRLEGPEFQTRRETRPSVSA